MMRGNSPSAERHQLSIYVMQHCDGCAYAREVAEAIRLHYPRVCVAVVDIGQSGVTIPDEIFATPTYMLNGKVWSLGNPSDEMIRQAFA